ncbi:MAG: carboxypeptidase-like regulatory domain-containing protein, partial [Acidobacteria bacterium]|nr:carboxypeptidase-like regulatory domain-containing protein [Acidobacteriota bacterium]
MSRCQPSVRTLPGLAMALAVLLAAGAAMAGDSAAVHPPQATATAVQTALRGIEGRLDRLQADITRAEHAAASPPGAFSRELEQLRWQVQDQTRRLVGLHWTVAGPVLSEANRLSGRADGLARRLENWQPSLPPDPSRPLKTSAATGTGTITGTLTDQSTGNPISYTRVEVYCPGSGFDAETMSGADGVYTMGGLDSGDCYVRTWNQQSYIDELYDDISCAAGCQLLDGTPVPVVDGEVTSGIDFILETAGAIRGTLTDAESGLPVTSAAVDLYDVSGSWVEGATTDAYGVYRLWELPAGTYFVRSDAPGDEYVNELYDDIACSSSCDPTTGTPVTVTPGQITTGIDFALEPTGAISGLVTESGSGDPICSSQLTAFDSTGTEIAMATSSCDGSYEIEGLPGGSYFVTATEASHRGQLYDGLPCYDSCDPTAGTPIQVGAGATTGDIDFALDPWPTPAVSGTVTDSVSGLPIGSGSVVLYDDQGDYAGSRQPDTDGQYVFGPLVPGTYFATATESTHLKELYQEIDCTYYCDPTDGTPITVGIGADAGGIDFTLEPESIIGGTVASVEGNPLTNVQVLVYDDSG